MNKEEDLKRQVLEVCRSYLCRTLRLTTHVSFLRSRSILSKEDDDDIKAEKGTLKQNEKFLDIISTKGPQGFDEFCNAIKDERTTGHVLEHINRELQTLIDQSTIGLPSPGECGAPPLPYPYNVNGYSEPYSCDSTEA